ncbi:MAG: DUF5979 domain-containing protein, partial [Betaproteobacteria bacterium]
WQLSVANIILPATGAHIHRGAVGVAGPIVVPLSAPDAAGKASGCVKVERSLAKELIQHPARFYVNVHTTDFSGGAIRGQLGKGFKSHERSEETGLKITKVVDGNTTGWAGGTFGFTVTCGASVQPASITLGAGQTTGSTKLSSVTPGATCVVAETSSPAAGANATWSATSYDPLGGSVTIAAGSTAKVKVTNTRAVTPGSLQITKIVGGNTTGWAGGTFTFSVTCGASVQTTSITLASGVVIGSVTVPNLTAGASCTVAETSATTPGVGASWGATTYAPSATATIPAASTVGVVVTDTRSIP